MSASFIGGIDGCAKALLAFATRNRHATDSVAKKNFKAWEETINIENFT
jgi:hypothetical protein